MPPLPWVIGCATLQLCCAVCQEGHVCQEGQLARWRAAAAACDEGAKRRRCTYCVRCPALVIFALGTLSCGCGGAEGARQL